MLLLVEASQAQNAGTVSYQAPQLIAPASGETIRSPEALHFRWRPAKGPSADEIKRYRQLYHRLLVRRKIEAPVMETTRQNQLRFVRTYPVLKRADQSLTKPPSPTPYPTVGDWFPAAKDEPPSPDSDGVLEVRLLPPKVGDWFPNGGGRASLPGGQYVWEVRLLGETPNGDKEILVSSQTATFAMSSQRKAPPATASSPTEGSPSTEGASIDVPDNVTLTLMPKGGLFLSGVSSFNDISGEASSALGGERSVFTWGGSVAFGARNGPVNFRLTGMRTSSSLVSTTDGVESTGTVRDRMLTFTGDIVVRPLPRFLIQPYAIGGLGARRLSVQQLEEVASNARWDLTAQVGAGADLRLGNVTLGVEIVDYLTDFTGSGTLQHDAFVFLTLGIPVF